MLQTGQILSAKSDFLGPHLTVRQIFLKGCRVRFSDFPAIIGEENQLENH